MMPPHQIEELILLIGAMNRPALVRQLRDVRAGFPIDFTPQFLDSSSLDRLRHILLALCLQCQQMPELAEDPADLPASTAA